MSQRHNVVFFFVITYFAYPSVPGGATQHRSGRSKGQKVKGFLFVLTCTSTRNELVCSRWKQCIIQVTRQDKKYVHKKKILAPIRANKQHSDQREDSRPVITEYNLMTLNHDFTAASSYTLHVWIIKSASQSETTSSSFLSLVERFSHDLSVHPCIHFQPNIQRAPNTHTHNDCY